MDLTGEQDKQNRRKRKTVNQKSKNGGEGYEENSKRGKKITGKRSHPKKQSSERLSETSAKNRKARKKNQTNCNRDEESSSNGDEESSSDSDEAMDIDSDISEDLESRSDSDEDLGSGSTSNEGSKISRKVKRRSARPLQLSPELAALVGAEQMVPFEVVLKIQNIIEDRNLYDPENKMFAICDEELLKIFGVRRFRRFSIISYLKDHLISKMKNIS